MLANNFSTSTCFVIFELIKFMCFGLDSVTVPAQRISHFVLAPAPNTSCSYANPQQVQPMPAPSPTHITVQFPTSATSFQHLPHNCGYLQPAQVNPPRAGL